jgi:hypothetical protein
MKECEALIKQPKKSTTLSTTATGTTGTSVSPSTPESDDEATGPRRPASYKLLPNVTMFIADGRTCEEWFFVFENALRT